MCRLRHYRRHLGLASGNPGSAKANRPNRLRSCTGRQSAFGAMRPPVGAAPLVCCTAATVPQQKCSFAHLRRNDRSVCESCLSGDAGLEMIEKEYFVRQALTLLRMARVVSNPAISAELLSKAADLEAKVDHPEAV